MAYRSVLLVTLLSLLLATPALAITYGQADGNRHPNVGALVGTFDGQTYPYCSGTLIAPTVFLTAAHCDIGVSKVFVTFDSVYTAKAKLVAGTFHGDPQYSQQQSDPHDIAVVVFDKPIKNLTPAALPTAGQFNNLKGDQQFTAVGYGGTQRLHAPGGGTPEFTYPDTRMYAVGTLNSVNAAWLRLSQNPAKEDGGTCYGDSGGPNFLGAGAEETNIIAGTTITGDSVCRATNVIYRLDTASARSFLSHYVIVPGLQASREAKASKDRHHGHRRHGERHEARRR
jgi:secreted trypsin-like serine protease